MRPADGVDVVDPGPEARALRRGVREELDPEEVGGGAEGGGRRRGGAAEAPDQRREGTGAIAHLQTGRRISAHAQEGDIR